MKKLATLCSGLCMAVGVAFAQPEPAFTPVLEERPFYNGVAGVALQREEGASAVLCCRARANRNLRCLIGWESQPRFGNVARDWVQRNYRLTEESYAQYASFMPDGWFPQPFQFELLHTTPAPPLPSHEEQVAMCSAPADD
jgi:hypothetical protein